MGHWDLMLPVLVIMHCPHLIVEVITPLHITLSVLVVYFWVSYFAARIEHINPFVEILAQNCFQMCLGNVAITVPKSAVTLPT